MLGWRTVCAVECNTYCQKVLIQRQNEGTFEPFPIWDDIRTFECKEWIGKVDIITAGFPCQPFSLAGRQHSKQDSRNMWPHTIRIIKEIQPTYAFLENVPGLLSKEYFKEILEGIYEAGYNVKWKCLSAQECGAPFQRNRLWMLLWMGNASIKEGNHRKSSQDQSITNISSNRLQNTNMEEKILTTITSSDWWSSEPDVVRVVSRIPHRVDRIKGLGNAWVPRVAAKAFLELKGKYMNNINEDNYTLEDDKQSLIDIVIWYRDEYSKGAKTYYDGLIKKIRNTKTQKELSTFEQIIDSWMTY